MPDIRTYRKRPITVEAIQWTGHNEAEIKVFTGGNFQAVSDAGPEFLGVTAEVFDRLHSTLVGVRTGQYIVRRLEAEFYPIDEQVLAETYERVDEGATDA